MNFKREILFPYRRIIGAYFVLSGLLLALNVMFPEIINTFIVILSILLILSVDVAIHSIGNRKLFGLVATSVSVALASILGLLIILLHWNIEKIWPLFGFCASLGMTFSFMVSGKRRMSMLIPGIFLALMSALILCFTTDFINLNSKYLLFFSVALLLMLSGILLICQGDNAAAAHDGTAAADKDNASADKSAENKDTDKDRGFDED